MPTLSANGRIPTRSRSAVAHSSTSRSASSDMVSVAIARGSLVTVPESGRPPSRTKRSTTLCQKMVCWPSATVEVSRTSVRSCRRRPSRYMPSRSETSCSPPPRRRSGRRRRSVRRLADVDSEVPDVDVTRPRVQGLVSVASARPPRTGGERHHATRLRVTASSAGCSSPARCRGRRPAPPDMRGRSA